MPPPSLARDFFERITQVDAVAFIRGLINSSPPTVETDWRDFKIEHHDPKQRERYIREEWSRSLGGFANNQGGVLVWGVDARKTKVGGVEIDTACGEKPMADPLGLRSRLVELQRGATDPPLANVDVRAYELADNPGKGFVVCYIPEGPFKPYRSEQADRQWYIRAGDNTVVMSRPMLQALFYPRTKAVFRLNVDLLWKLPEERQIGRQVRAAMTLVVRAANVGTATAKHILLGPISQLEQFGTVDLGPTWEVESTFLRKSTPMHPGLPPSVVCRLTWSVPASTGYPSCPGPEFRIAMYAENQEPQCFEAMFGVDELKVRQHISLELSPREPF